MLNINESTLENKSIPKVLETLEGVIVDGTYNGEFLVGDDGKQYPVPGNYASKSKLIEGDKLRMNITTDGRLLFKLILPAERMTRMCKVVEFRGRLYVFFAQKLYRMRKETETFFGIKAGDTVVAILPVEGEWCAISGKIGNT